MPDGGDGGRDAEPSDAGEDAADGGADAGDDAGPPTPIPPDAPCVLHVSRTGGSDEEGRGAAAMPLLTIGRALEVAADGDVICIAEGSYAEALVVRKRVAL